MRRKVAWIRNEGDNTSWICKRWASCWCSYVNRIIYCICFHNTIFKSTYYIKTIVHKPKYRRNTGEIKKTHNQVSHISDIKNSNNKSECWISNLLNHVISQLCVVIYIFRFLFINLYRFRFEKSSQIQMLSKQFATIFFHLY